MEKKKLGILGGMGSEATVLFYKKIIDNTSVNNPGPDRMYFVWQAGLSLGYHCK